MEIHDRYRIERELGKGGFGTTYLAEDLTRQRMVAVKVAGADDPEFVARFREEAALLGRVRHPNIATIQDFGVREGRPYLVIDYVDGPTLEEVLSREGRLPVPMALAVLRAVAAGLAAIHREGFIHRDIKPSNVILRGNSYEDATLVDFGVAGRLTEQNATRTQTGQVFGTIRSMAPEQLLGRPQSAATDVYGLGVLLFWMLFGRPPFEGATPMAQIATS